MIIERKCFVCEGFGHITHHCKNMGEKKADNGGQCDVVEFTDTDIGIVGSGRSEKKETARKRTKKKRK